MQDLIKQERFELEVLDRLNSKRLLKDLVFGGGTMLRLCWNLNRFSVDLDFWIIKTLDFDKIFIELKNCLAQFYKLTDCTNKFYTLLFEMRSKDYPQSLKLEIRKETKEISIEPAIAFSKYSNTQVFLNTVSLKDMMAAKIQAFLGRREIRDAFDLEFLLKKEIPLDASVQVLEKVLRVIRSLTKKDYSVKLGSLLEARERKYYSTENFKILEAAIKQCAKI